MKLILALYVWGHISHAYSARLFGLRTKNQEQSSLVFLYILNILLLEFWYTDYNCISEGVYTGQGLSNE